MSALRSYFLLSVLCCMLYLPGICSIPILDEDSAHFAQATRQMLETGNYFQIRFQSVTRFQKPPGINWLQALSVHIFSPKDFSNVWPYRIPSVLGGLLSVLLTFGIAKRFCSEKVAFLGASLLASSVLLIVESHLAVIDASLLSAVVLMQGALWIMYDSSRRHEPVAFALPLLFWLAMGYGFLLKGVTPLVGVLTVIGLSIVDRNIRWLKILRWQWGIIIFLLSCSWLIGVDLAEHSNYLMRMFQEDLWPKLVSGVESHGYPPGMHLVMLLGTLWPASLFLWQMVLDVWQHRHQPFEKFLLAWIVPTWIFFELMPTKLPQYVLPTFPAIALLLAHAVIRFQVSSVNDWQRCVLRIQYGIWGVLSGCLGIAIVIASYEFTHHIPLIMWVSAVVVIVSSAMAVIACFKGYFEKAAWFAILIAVFTFVPIYHTLLPRMQLLWLSDRVATKIQQLAPGSINSQQPLRVVGYAEPSLVFELGTDRVALMSVAELIESLKHQKNGYFLINRQDEVALLNQLPMLTLHVKKLATVSGFNYSKGRYTDLILYEIIK